MKKYLVALFFACSSLTWGIQPDPVLSEKELKQNVNDLLDAIQLSFQSYYAPRNWKGEHNGWHLRDKISEIKLDVNSRSTISMRDAQQAVKNFFKSTSDYHVSVYFWREDYAWLPFDVVGAEGKYFISYIYRDRLSEASFPFEVGDEIVSFNGRPTQEVIDDLMASELGGSNDLTNRGLAEMFLTVRLGWLGMDVPNGPITVRVRPNNSCDCATPRKERSVQLVWCYSPAKIPEPYVANDSATSIAVGANWAPEMWPGMQKKEPKEMLRGFMNKRMMLPCYDGFHRVLKSRDACHENPHTLGSRDSVLPQLGPLWWTPEDGDYGPFQAYVYQSPSDHNIGFIRIPHYGGDAWEAEQFGEIIQHFEESCDAIVIDQMWNPGGNVFYLYGLASMLTDEPLVTPKHHMAIDQLDVLYSMELLNFLEYYVTDDEDAKFLLGDSFFGYPVSYQMIQLWISYLRFVIEEWKGGHTITRPYHIAAVDHINPNPNYRFTKPILFLTNHMDFSGGDFLPAILQDNERVRIMGCRTAGAGGYITQGGMENNLGLAGFVYTGSIAERVDGMPIEDLGVTPDVWYESSANDIQQGYAEFTQKIHVEIADMLGEDDDAIDITEPFPVSQFMDLDQDDDGDGTEEGVADEEPVEDGEPSEED